MPWPQNYAPLPSGVLSVAVAALPVVVLLGALASRRIQAHTAALLGLATALLVAIGVLGMPARLAVEAAGFGAVYGLFPIGWIVLNVIFLYRLTREAGQFDVLQRSITGITADRRLQLLLVAFCFGAFFEGAAGFGTPVAVTAAVLIGLGFGPLEASGLSLLANTAPVAFGALGTPIIALQGVTGLDLHALSAMVGRQLPLFSVIVPFWLIWAYAGFRGMLEVWPALLVAGVAFAAPQALVANLHGPWLVDVVASVASMAALAGFLKVWRPAPAGARAPAAALVPAGASHESEPGGVGVEPGAGGAGHARVRDDAPGGAATLAGPGAAPDGPADPRDPASGPPSGRRDPAPSTLKAWAPWLVLSILVFLWGLPTIKNALNAVSAPKLPVPGLDRAVLRLPPVVASAQPEPAAFLFNWLSATGTAILLAALLSGALLGFGPRRLARAYWETLKVVRLSLLTIAAMLALGYVTRYAGLDAILGLAFARTGPLYPFFGTLLGWLGVALTGSDTSSNVLFGSLQKITAQQLGLSPTLMAAANSSGGVMGKMIDAQSIVVASTATRWYGHEWEILRFVFWHSLALAGLVGGLVMLQAYVWPFVRLVVP